MPKILFQRFSRSCKLRSSHPFDSRLIRASSEAKINHASHQAFCDTTQG